MKRIATFATAALLSLPLTLDAQDAGALIKKHTSEAVASIEAYLEANPTAGDKLEAYDFLIDSYQRLGEEKKVSEYQSLKYSVIPKGRNIDQREFFSAFQAVFADHIRNGDKDAARAALVQAKLDIKDHPMEERFLVFIDQIGSQLKTPELGDIMDLKFTSMQGEEIDLAAMRGKVVLVDFWATWCAPCKAEMPNLKKNYDEFHERGFEIIGVSLDDEKTKARLDGYLEQHGLPWPQSYDGGGLESPLAEKFGITSIPATFLIGKDGKIVGKNPRGTSLRPAIINAMSKS